LKEYQSFYCAVKYYILKILLPSNQYPKRFEWVNKDYDPFNLSKAMQLILRCHDDIKGFQSYAKRSI